MALVLMIIGLCVFSCKKEEPLEPFEERLYKQTKIAFTSNRDGEFAIYTMNPDGSEAKKLTDIAAEPSWSPDVQKMAFFQIEMEMVRFML